MRLQQALIGPAERLRKLFRVQTPSDWVPSSSIRSGRSGLIICQTPQGEYQAKITGMWGYKDALTCNERWLASTLYEVHQSVVPISSYLVRKGNRWHEVTMKDNSLMNCAAILKSWKSNESVTQEGFVLLTTHANVMLTPFYKEMPVLLHPSEVDSWLQGERPMLQELYRIASPYPSDLLQVNQCIRQ